MSNEKPQDASEGSIGQSASTSLPWHIGFHNEIADMLRPAGDWHPDMVRYQVVQICAHDGRHVAWACSQNHAALIMEAVNKMANDRVEGRDAASSRRVPSHDGLGDGGK